MPRTVLEAFDRLLADQELSGKQLIAVGLHVSGVGKFLQGAYAMAEEPFTIGSAARDTICRSERDIDILAPFSVRQYWERFSGDSRAFLYWVRKGLNDNYGRTEVSSKQVAVKIDFSDIVTDVVPAFRRNGGGYLIPNGRGGWRATNPPFHTDLVAKADGAKGGRLRSLIKLLKAWNSANGHHLTSFHVELMVERMKRSYAVGAWPAEVAAVLKTMPTWLRVNFPDPWTDGGRVDEYLTDAAREQAIRMLESDAKAAAQGEEYRNAGKHEEAFERWDVIYRHTFPSFG